MPILPWKAAQDAQELRPLAGRRPVRLTKDGAALRRPNTRLGTPLLACTAALAVLAGCDACWPDYHESTPAEAIDFAKAHGLAVTLFDVSSTVEITDEQLAAAYQTDFNEVLVRSTTFAGDTSPSRYMFIKDPVAQKQAIYLSGTNSDTLWRFDLDLAMVDDQDLQCRVHRGFDNAALTVLDDVLPRLETDYSITVTGYSIGGAMAVLLAQYLVVNGYQVVDVITFGQPKVTDVNGVARFANLPLLRFVNHLDPVPHLPPDGIGTTTMAHFGPEVVLYDGTDYAFMGDGDLNYVRSTTGDLVTILTTGNFNEHGRLYVDRLAAKLDQANRIPYTCR